MKAIRCSRVMELMDTQAIEEFMQGYFAERAELHRLHWMAWNAFLEESFTTDYLAALREGLCDDYWQYEKRNPAVITSISTKPGRQLAIVITSEPEDCEQVQYRYYLLATKAGWRIDRKGKKCSSCDGAGSQSDIMIGLGVVGCWTCKGLGWCYCRSRPV